MLAKKEYELIAGIIRILPNRTTKADVVKRFADRLGLSNPNFDRGKFFQACKAETES